MILSDLSIRRPVFATVMVLVLVTLGIFSYRWLPVEMYPNVEIPVLSIVTKFPGAGPESVEREVSKRVEEAVNGISGVKHVYSFSREGVSTVVVEFRLEERINEVTQEARAKVNAIRGILPKGIEEPIIQKLDFNAMPIVSLAVRSETLSPRDLTVLVEKNVKRRFEGIAGVGKVDLVGAAKREVNVIIDPERLNALGLGVDAVVAGLRSENVNTPLGRLNRGATEVNLRVSGKPDRVEQFREMVITVQNGRPIRLGEVAEVRDGVEEQRSLALVNGAPAVSLDILKQAGANIVEVADAVKRTAESMRTELPPGTTISVVRDSSMFIRESLDDVQQTLILGGILTILIVFCFINSWRSTVITGVTLPISVHVVVHHHEGPGDVDQRDDDDGPVAGHRTADRRCDRRSGEHRPPPGARGRPFGRRPQRDERDRARRVRHDDVDRGRLRAGRLHEGDRRPLLLPVRDDGRLRRPRLAVCLLHPGPDALLALARSGDCGQGKKEGAWRSCWRGSTPGSTGRPTATAG